MMRDWSGPLTEKQATTMTSLLSKLDRLWGLDRSPPLEPAPVVFARSATIALPESARALLGREPIPLPGQAQPATIPPEITAH